MSGASVEADDPTEAEVGDVLTVTVEGWDVRSPAGDAAVVAWDGVTVERASLPVGGSRPATLA